MSRQNIALHRSAVTNIASSYEWLCGTYKGVGLQALDIRTEEMEDN